MTIYYFFKSESVKSFVHSPDYETYSTYIYTTYGHARTPPPTPQSTHVTLKQEVKFLLLVEQSTGHVQVIKYMVLSMYGSFYILATMSTFTLMTLNQLRKAHHLYFSLCTTPPHSLPLNQTCDMHVLQLHHTHFHCLEVWHVTSILYHSTSLTFNALKSGMSQAWCTTSLHSLSIP